MKKILFFALAIAGLGMVSSCGHTQKAEATADSDSMLTDSVIVLEGEWIITDTVPMTQSAAGTTASPQASDKMPQSIKLNGDNTAQSVNITSTIYQAWNQKGDTLTLISQNAIDPMKQDTVSWQIIALTGDSMKIANPQKGVKTLKKKK